MLLVPLPLYLHRLRQTHRTSPIFGILLIWIILSATLRIVSGQVISSYSQHRLHLHRFGLVPSRTAIGCFGKCFWKLHAFSNFSSSTFGPAHAANFIVVDVYHFEVHLRSRGWAKHRFRSSVIVIDRYNLPTLSHWDSFCWCITASSSAEFHFFMIGHRGVVSVIVAIWSTGFGYIGCLYVPIIDCLGVELWLLSDLRVELWSYALLTSEGCPFLAEVKCWVFDDTRLRIVYCLRLSKVPELALRSLWDQLRME